MKLLKEIQTTISIAGEDVDCIVYANVFYSHGNRFGMSETFVDEVEIDEVLALNSGIIDLRTIDNITRLENLVYDKVINEVLDTEEDNYSNDVIDHISDLDKEWS